ncbi:MAG: Hsp20/alpha crystallin family protein [Bacteroidales bacterium]|nr:Hsp20/alpha crystallin family protein [Bacteroidales bacterium]
MTTLMRNNENWLPSLFNEFLNDDYNGRYTNVKSGPCINIKENTDNYVIEIAAPGMSKEDFKIAIDDYNNLSIVMEKNMETTEKSKFLRKEFSYKKFSQSFLIPKNVDKEKIGAKEEHGILTITLPKFSEDASVKKQRVIEIQ